MGNHLGIDPSHVRIYSNLLQIQSVQKRTDVIQTCFASMEYINSAKRAGIYSYLLNYISTVQMGQMPPPLPGENGGISASATSTPPLPRSLQHVPLQTAAGIGATHPSLVHATTASNYSAPPSASHQSIIQHTEQGPSWKVITDTPKQKALTYFSSCLEVLGIKEEITLTEETLKKAYKKMAIKAHPDKAGGSEEYFEAVTRAYAYLSEILRYMKGGQKATNGKVDAPSHVSTHREAEAKQWEHAAPVRLDPNNLNMNAFNALFEETRIPDPDSDGYGDWLKGGDGDSSSAPKFKGQFNRDVFNRMFDEEARISKTPSNQLVVHPGEMALTMNPNSGVNFVGQRPETYTAAPNSKMQFTDLRGAYTTESTISDKVANVPVTERKLEQYRASRERAPDPLSSSEMESIRAWEMRQKQQEDALQRQRAEMAASNQGYFDRMKQRVIMNGAVDLNQKKIGY